MQTMQRDRNKVVYCIMSPNLRTKVWCTCIAFVIRASMAHPLGLNFPWLTRVCGDYILKLHGLCLGCFLGCAHRFRAYAE